MPDIAPRSREVIIGLVGYAGAGCSTAVERVQAFLGEYGYKTAHHIKLSALIAQECGAEVSLFSSGEDGRSKLERAMALQDAGDSLRKSNGSHAVALLAVEEIKRLRASSSVDDGKVAYILDSIKHEEEVYILRKIYEQSFRLLAIHCERNVREKRLISKRVGSAKYRGADDVVVKQFMDRDERDQAKAYGQHVRDAFYLADYFLDNNANAVKGSNMSLDIERFVKLLLGAELVRPKIGERAIYHAHAAALQSSCLSRQVGAVLVSRDGELVSSGTNDAPRYRGGVYDEDAVSDARCHAWEWEKDALKFRGCHNDRKKNDLRKEIGRWLGREFCSVIAEIAVPRTDGQADLLDGRRDDIAKKIREYFNSAPEELAAMPGVKDLIEFSRAVHAEMAAIMGAARSGVSPSGGSIYCTTYPCHNCARHLVAAGIETVYYIEPYTKSLASELHYDAIATEREFNPDGSEKKLGRMLITPFTGVGPRMYEDSLVKKGDLKVEGGVYKVPQADVPALGVRLNDFANVEDAAIKLLRADS